MGNYAIGASKFAQMSGVNPNGNIVGHSRRLSTKESIGEICFSGDAMAQVDLSIA